MINLKQLHHFWLVGRTGSIQRAAETSGLTPQTISGQIGVLEGAIGRRLLQRKGRGIELTEAAESRCATPNRSSGSPKKWKRHSRAKTNSPPYPIVWAARHRAEVARRPAARAGARTPAETAPERDRRPLPRLLSELMLGRLDALITDGPPPAQLGNKLQCRLLIESRLALYARPGLSLALPITRSCWVSRRHLPALPHHSGFSSVSAPRSIWIKSIAKAVCMDAG